MHRKAASPAVREPGLTLKVIHINLCGPVGAVLLTAIQEGVSVNLTKLARISTLALILFLTSLSAFAQPPCGCNYCQEFPERECRSGGVRITCADFLIVALCPAGETATSTDALSSEAAFLASLSEPASEPTPAN
jgi:hypothetical protein